MERVETLCNKLQEQIKSRVPVDQLLITVQMLQSEIQHIQRQNPVPVSQNSTAFHVPFTNPGVDAKHPETIEEGKIIEILQVDEAEVEAELEEIRKNLASREKLHVQNKPAVTFDPIEDTPTLAHQHASENVSSQKELHESLPSNNAASLNEKLKQPKTELSDALQDIAIKDLRKGIGVNDRFLFINELFRGDDVMYERSIKTINGFTIFPEAEYWIKRELKLKLAWSDNNPVVKQFDQLIRRRFSAM
ncbi:MAG: hypothetical protein ABIP80_04935 [Ferruginibacter sp.]